jgi:hypothetical protein
MYHANMRKSKAQLIGTQGAPCKAFAITTISTAILSRTSDSLNKGRSTFKYDGWSTSKFFWMVDLQIFLEDVTLSQFFL